MSSPQEGWSPMWLNFTAGTTPSTTHIDPEFLATIEPTDTMLDIGCGHGRATEIFAAAAARVTGIDINLAELSQAASTQPANVDYVAMGGEDLRFRDDTFDKTALLGVLGGVSLSIRQRILEEAVRVTRPGGLVYVSEYPLNPATPGSTERYSEGERITGEPGAFVVVEQGTNGALFTCKHFSEDELKGMLTAAGLTNLEVRMPVVERQSLTDSGRTFMRQVLCAWGEKQE